MSTAILESNQVDIVDDTVVIGSKMPVSSQEKRSHAHFQSLDDFADTSDDQDNESETQNDISKHIGHEQQVSSSVTEDSSTLNTEITPDAHKEERVDNTDARYTPANKNNTAVKKSVHGHGGTHGHDSADAVYESTGSSNRDDGVGAGGDAVRAGNDEFGNTSSVTSSVPSSKLQDRHESSDTELQNALSEKEDALVALQNKNSELQQQLAAAQKNNAADKNKERHTTEEKEHILRSAREEGDKIIADAHARSAEVNKDAYEKGYAAGKKEGLSNGYESVEALIVRMREITGKILQKRTEIMEKMEPQVIDLVILIAKKVIKIISKESKDVIVENVQHALAMVRKKGEIIIRINPVDLNISSEYLKKMTKSIEHEGTIQFIEDGLIEQGGCVVESEFGEIDARIHSQILEMENKIRA